MFLACGLGVGGARVRLRARARARGRRGRPRGRAPPAPPPPPLQNPPPPQAALRGGKGRLRRDTESGAVLVDLARHGDVAELAAWINSFGDRVYRTVWGDKAGFMV